MEDDITEEAPPRQFRQYIAVSGYWPGIPGALTPGLYDIDLDARTATRVTEDVYLVSEGGYAVSSGMIVLTPPEPIVEPIVATPPTSG